jgi:hypothetical protein
MEDDYPGSMSVDRKCLWYLKNIHYLIFYGLKLIITLKLIGMFRVI